MSEGGGGDAHGGSHDHGAGGHAHGRPVAREGHTGRLKWTLVLVLTYMAAEVVGGLVSGSLALLADAGHMLSDAGSLALALFALWIARRPPTARRTYGYYRTEILAALANGVTLVVVSLYVFREAWLRMGEPPEVAGPLMMGVATGGLVVNGIGLVLLHSGRNENLNLRGAWLHVAADAAGSLGAIVAGGLVWGLGWNLADPVASMLIGLLVLASSWTLLKESVAVLMESAPGGIDVDQLRDAMMSVSGVAAVHHLHVWTISSGMASLSAHVVVDGRQDHDVLAEVRSLIHERFGVAHCTIQVEPEAFEEPETPF